MIYFRKKNEYFYLIYNIDLFSLIKNKSSKIGI